MPRRRARGPLLSFYLRTGVIEPEREGVLPREEPRAAEPVHRFARQQRSGMAAHALRPRFQAGGTVEFQGKECTFNLPRVANSAVRGRMPASTPSILLGPKTPSTIDLDSRLGRFG